MRNFDLINHNQMIKKNQKRDFCLKSPKTIYELRNNTPCGFCVIFLEKRIKNFYYSCKDFPHIFPPLKSVFCCYYYYYDRSIERHSHEGSQVVWYRYKKVKFMMLFSGICFFMLRFLKKFFSPIKMLFLSRGSLRHDMFALLPCIQQKKSSISDSFYEHSLSIFRNFIRKQIFHRVKRELELISFNPESEIAVLLFIHFFCHHRE